MTFEERFNQFIPELTEALTIPNSRDWTVKGFIDYYQNIYSISTDTNYTLDKITPSFHTLHLL